MIKNPWPIANICKGSFAAPCHAPSGWVFSVPRLVPVVFLVPRSWCFQFLDWCFPCPAPVLVFLVPGLGVFSPGQCVPCPAPVLVCPFTCLFVSFRLNFWLPLPTAGFESTYSCHTIKQTKNTAKPSKPFAGKHVSLRKPTAAKTQGTR